MAQKFRTMTRYLVTGGAGFIGSNLVEALVDQGAEVRVLDDFSTGKQENISAFRDRIQLIEGSVGDLRACQIAMRGVDFVLHHAAIASVPMSIERPQDTHEINLTGTLNLLGAARDAGVRRFIYASSASVYGDTPELPKVETMPAYPASPYAIQKYGGELYCRAFYENYGLETISLRYFNVFGQKQDPKSQYAAVIPRFIVANLQGEAPVLYGDGQQSRDFVHVDNVVRANLAACTASSRCAGSVLNIGSGEPTKLVDLAQAIRSIAGGDRTPRHEKERPGDIRHSLADISAAREAIEYEPRVSFRKGLQKTIESLRSSL